MASKKPNRPSKQFSEYLPNLRDPGSFFFNAVSPLEIENEIMSTPLIKQRTRLILLSKSNLKIGKICYKPTSFDSYQ